MKNITVASFNIHHGANQQNQFDLDKLTAFLKSVPAEVIILNEVDQDWSDRSDNKDLPQVISKQVLQQSYFAPSITNSRSGKYGNMILSRQPLDNRQSYQISDLAVEYQGDRFTEPRTCLSAQVNIGNQVCTIIGTHLGFGADQQHGQVNQLIKRYNLNQPTIILGDFNAKLSDPPLQIIAHHLPICTNFTGIDHIFASSHFKLVASGQVENDVSDHPLVWAELELKEELES